VKPLISNASPTKKKKKVKTKSSITVIKQIRVFQKIQQSMVAVAPVAQGSGKKVVEPEILRAAWAKTARPPSLKKNFKKNYLNIKRHRVGTTSPPNLNIVIS
jgi:hypothetical protein